MHVARLVRERDMNMNEEGRFQKRVGWAQHV
jgi:hypothetical protein